MLKKKTKKIKSKKEKAVNVATFPNDHKIIST